MRPAPILGLLATAASIAIAAETEPVHDIRVTADVPTVTVSPRQAGRMTMHLPSLTYALTVSVDCEANWQPDSVSISVADSRASLNAEQLQADRELNLELMVPSNQIAPLRIEKFCIAGSQEMSDAANQNSVMVSGVMSAQASLRCATESAQSTMYVTKPLDVLLECAVPEPTKKPNGQFTLRRLL